MVLSSSDLQLEIVREFTVASLLAPHDICANTLGQAAEYSAETGSKARGFTLLPAKATRQILLAQTQNSFESGHLLKACGFALAVSIEIHGL